MFLSQIFLYLYQGREQDGFDRRFGEFLYHFGSFKMTSRRFTCELNHYRSTGKDGFLGLNRSFKLLSKWKKGGIFFHMNLIQNFLHVIKSVDRWKFEYDSESDRFQNNAQTKIL